MLTSAELTAALLGVLCGSVMIAMLVFIPLALKKRSSDETSSLSQNSPSQDSPSQNDFMPQELLHSLFALMGTFLFCTIAILIYNSVAPDTLAWFGVAAVIWYLAGFTVYALSRIAKERKPMEK